MPPSPEPLPTAPETINEGQTPAQLREAFLRAWQSGQRPRIEDYLVFASTEERSHVLQMLLRDELAFRKQASEQLTFADYLSRFPGDRDTVVQAFD